MDEWEAMASPRTAASYYMQRSGVSVSGSGTQLDLSSPISAHGVNASVGELNASAGLSKGEPDASAILSQGEPSASAAILSKGEPSASAGLSQGESVRRKPGRPRKRGPDGTVWLGLPKSVQPNLGGKSAESAFQPNSSSPISAHGADASPISAHGVTGLSQEELNASVRLSQEEHNASAGLSQGEPIRRKPGRPRKRGPDGAVLLRLPKKNMSVQSGLGDNSDGSAFQPDSSSPISAHGVNASSGQSQGELNASAGLSQEEHNASPGISQEEPNASAGLPQEEHNVSPGISQEEPNAASGLSQGEPVRRKPGRPRKRGPDGAVLLRLPKKNMSVQSGLGGNSDGSAFQPDSSSPISAHGVNASSGQSQGELNASAGLSQEEHNASPGLSQEEHNASPGISQEEPNTSAGLSQGEPVRRKPGRPRKRGPDGIVSFGLPKSVQSNVGGNSAESALQPDSSSPIPAHGADASEGEPVRRRRPGRPRKIGPDVRRRAGRPRKIGPDGRRRPGRPRKKGTNWAESIGLPKQNMPVQSNLGGNASGSAFQLDSLPLISAHGVDASAGLSQREPVTRRPGRPRTRGLFSVSSPPPPPPSHGQWLFGSAGMGLTPHIITIAVGEDITEKIMSFSEQEPRAVCILSANGTVSMVTLLRPSTSSGTVKYEGCFEILWLSGSYMLTDNDGSRSRTGGLSVCLCGHNGEVICGGVGEMLVAATPVQVIVGSFLYSGSKTNHTVVTVSDSSANSESRVDSGDESVPSTGIPPSNQKLQV